MGSALMPAAMSMAVYEWALGASIMRSGSNSRNSEHFAWKVLPLMSLPTIT